MALTGGDYHAVSAQRHSQLFALTHPVSHEFVTAKPPVPVFLWAARSLSDIGMNHRGDSAFDSASQRNNAERRQFRTPKDEAAICQMEMIISA